MLTNLIRRHTCERMSRIVTPGNGLTTTRCPNSRHAFAGVSPDQICQHVGTNDLKSSTLSDVADAIIDLAREAENASESEIVISELTARNGDYCDAVKAVNKRLKQFCNENNWKLISHANVSSKGLNKGDLHLSGEGNELLQQNFVNFLRSN